MFRKKKKTLPELLMFDDNADKRTYHVKISKEENFYKLLIKEDVPIRDYVKIIRDIDNMGVDSLFQGRIYFDYSSNNAEKGIYYAFYYGNKLFNIGFSKTNIVIFQREKFDEYMEDRYIRYSINNSNFRYFKLKHNNGESTFYSKFYDCTKNNSFPVPELVLSFSEALDDIDCVIKNMTSIENIDMVIDLVQFRKKIFGDSFKKERKKD